MHSVSSLPAQPRQILQNFFAFILEDSGAILTSLSLINHTASEEETSKVLQDLCNSQQEDLVELHLHYNPRFFENEMSMERIVEFIMNQKKLKRLWLHDNYLKSSAIETLLTGLISNIKQQRIENIFLGNSSFETLQSCKLLAEYVNESKHLKFLDIQNQIGSKRIHLSVTKSKNNYNDIREPGQIIIRD